MQYTLTERIKFYILQYQKQTSDPVEVAFSTLSHFIDMYSYTYTKEFKELWEQADFYWVIVAVDIIDYGHCKWHLRKGYEFPLSMNPDYIAKGIIGAIEEVVQILNERFPELQIEDGISKG